MRGQPVLPGTRVNLEFGKQAFSGFTGCNDYGGGPDSGTYAATDDGVLQLLEFVVTAVGRPDDIMAQEKVYLEALASAATYRLSDRRLEIQNAAGETILVYAQRAECAEAPANLAGTAWRLALVDGQAPLNGAATTLGFVDDQWFSHNVGTAGIGGREITYADIDHVLDSAKAVYLPLDREVINVIPAGYSIVGQNGIKNPVGMTAERLEAKVYAVTGAVTPIQNLLKCCEKAGVEVADIVFAPVASADAVLTEDERELGVALVDIGGGTTDMIFYRDGGPVYASVLAIGGNHFTNHCGRPESFLE